jgi:pyocin large subunit-like protein
LALAACDAGPSAVVHDGEGKAPTPVRAPASRPVWAAAHAEAPASTGANTDDTAIAEASMPIPGQPESASASAAPADFEQRDLAVAQAYPPLPTGNRAEITETKYGDWPLWSKTRKLSPAENSRNAFAKHGQEVGAKSYEDYMAMVHAFVHAPPKGIETLTRRNGDVLMFDAKSDVFAVITKAGAPRTLFRPFDGQAYWQKQQQIEATRTNGGGAGGDGGE